MNAFWSMIVFLAIVMNAALVYWTVRLRLEREQFRLPSIWRAKSRDLPEPEDSKAGGETEPVGSAPEAQTTVAQDESPPAPDPAPAAPVKTNQNAYADQKSCPFCWLRIVTFNAAGLGPHVDQIGRMPFEVFDQLRILIGCAKKALPGILVMSQENGTRPKLDKDGKIILDAQGNPVPHCVGCANFENRRGQNVPADEPPIKILPDAKGM